MKMNESYSAWKKKRVGKQKFELIWKIILSINQHSPHVIKIASKRATLSERFTELWHEEESLWNILLDNYNIRQENEKRVGRMAEKLEMTNN